MPFNDKQILKNYYDDRDYSCSWEKTLKYAKSKDLPFEYIFSLIAFETESIQGLPYFLVLSGRISNPDYMFNGISIAIIFEIFRNTNRMENPFLISGGTFLVDSDNIDLDVIKLVLLNIKDKNIILPILSKNKELLFNYFKAEKKPYFYETYFSNFASYAYLSSDIDIVYIILFDLNLSKDEINTLLFDTGTSYREDMDTLFLQIIRNSDIDLLIKLDEKYSLDISLSRSISNLIFNMLSTRNYPFREKFDIDKKHKVIDFLISKNVDSLFSLLDDNSHSLRNPFFDLAKIFRKSLSSDSYLETEYYFNHTDTRKNNFFFWSLVFIDDVEFIKNNYSSYSASEKETLFLKTAETKNYNVLNLFLEDSDFDLNYKHNEMIPLYMFLYSGKFNLDEKIYVSSLFLDAGSRINDINTRAENLDEYLKRGVRDASNIKKIDEFISSYSDSYIEIVSFNLSKLDSSKPLSYVSDILIQLKDILLKKEFYSSIDKISFIREDNDNYIFSVDDELISIPATNISGNEFTKNSFKRI